jgi:hypothetical protein
MSRPEVPAPGRGVIHWEIGARDAERLRKFYADLFGWEIRDAGPGYSLVVSDGDGIGGGILQVEDPMPTYLTVYVGVDDVETVLARSATLGATETVAPTLIPGVGYFAMFRDPEGHDIGILAPLPTRPLQS